MGSLRAIIAQFANAFHQKSCIILIEAAWDSKLLSILEMVLHALTQSTKILIYQNSRKGNM